MKRLLSILIILSLLISLSGCKLINKIFGKDKQDNDTPTTQTPIENPININGVSIKEYKIVCDSEGLDYNIRAAEYIRDKIAAHTGCTLSIVDDSEQKSNREIVVGETTREISKELNTDTQGFQFAVLSKSGTVAIEADYFVIAAAAYYLVETYLSDGDTEIPDKLTVTTPVAKEAKNFILLIGDGMGVYQTMMFDYMDDLSAYNEDDYSDGEDDFYGYMFPYLGFSRTKSFSGITDSAAGGTALSTGYKTLNGYVGLDRNGNELKSLTELAAELGKATAVMSTEDKTGATPATFSAHADSRDSSDEIRNDQTLLTQNIGTIIECGYDYYNSRNMKNSIEKRISDTLSQLDKDEDGFFLMYEEAHIDKHCHKNDMSKTFQALVRFNQAIARFMEYAFYNPDTMVIITADHETGGLLPGEDGALSYNSEEHTAADVPVFAWGYGTNIFNGATVENIEIAHFFAKSMGVDNFGDQTRNWYSEIYPGGTELPIIPIG